MDLLGRMGKQNISCISMFPTSYRSWCISLCITHPNATLFTLKVFHFGFVIPGSTNTWQSVVESATDEKGSIIASSRDMRGAEVTIETHFYDDKAFLCNNSIHVRYV